MDRERGEGWAGEKQDLELRWWLYTVSTDPPGLRSMGIGFSSLPACCVHDPACLPRCPCLTSRRGEGNRRGSISACMVRRVLTLCRQNTTILAGDREPEPRPGSPESTVLPRTGDKPILSHTAAAVTGASESRRWMDGMAPYVAFQIVAAAHRITRRRPPSSCKGRLLCCAGTHN